MHLETAPCFSVAKSDCIESIQKLVMSVGPRALQSGWLIRGSFLTPSPLPVKWWRVAHLLEVFGKHSGLCKLPSKDSVMSSHPYAFCVRYCMHLCICRACGRGGTLGDPGDLWCYEKGRSLLVPSSHLVPLLSVSDVWGQGCCLVLILIALPQVREGCKKPSCDVSFACWHSCPPPLLFSCLALRAPGRF